MENNHRLVVVVDERQRGTVGGDCNGAAAVVNSERQPAFVHGGVERCRHVTPRFPELGAEIDCLEREKNRQIGIICPGCGGSANQPSHV